MGWLLGSTTPSGAAGGDLAGSYPSPTVAWPNGLLVPQPFGSFPAATGSGHYAVASDRNGGTLYQDTAAGTWTQIGVGVLVGQAGVSWPSGLFYAGASGGSTNADAAGTMYQVSAYPLDLPYRTPGSSIAPSDIALTASGAGTVGVYARIGIYADSNGVPGSLLWDPSVGAADGAMGTGSAVLTSASNLFTSAMVGQRVVVAGAGAAGAHLATTVLSFQNAGQITLNASNASGGNISAKAWVVGVVDGSITTNQSVGVAIGSQNSQGLTGIGNAVRVWLASASQYIAGGSPAGFTTWRTQNSPSAPGIGSATSVAAPALVGVAETGQTTTGALQANWPAGTGNFANPRRVSVKL